MQHVKESVNNQDGLKACPHWRFKLDWCGLNLDQSCPHLIHIPRKWILSRSKLDWANPCTVGGLHLDREWIITGNEVLKWQAHSLIETHVRRKCRAFVGVYKKLTHCCIYREQTVSKASWMGYSETRLCTSEWQVCYHMTIIGPCVRILTS